MLSQFYNSIIDEEKKMFNVKDQSLKKAAKDIADIYSTDALKVGSTFLDYNVPANRYAYLHKFAALHTGIVAKYSKEVIAQQEVKVILEAKKHLKICCLGGGPGTDIVGIIKTLAAFPAFNKKVDQVTVLDICGGWRNSFNRIISRLKHGKVENVPATFIDGNNFKADLIEVNLLGPLPLSVAKILANADIICMVKFVSAILGKPESVPALKVIGEQIKLGAVVLFIDNHHKTKFVPLEEISQQTGFSTNLGPLYVFYKHGGSKKKDSAYDCKPLSSLGFTVIGWSKTNVSSVTINNINTVPCSINDPNEDNEENWNTESESEDSNPEPFKIIPLRRRSKNLNNSRNMCCKFTQTNPSYSVEDKVDKVYSSNEINELSELIEALADLCKVMKRATTKQCL